jgi:signal transduction histidine kinase
MRRVNARGVVTVTSIVMLAGIFALDVLTPQRLVAAILLNIPIALSGLAYQRRLTLALVAGAIVADVLAGVLNAQSEAGFDDISLLNRTMLAASFALVGAMTVMLLQTSSRLEASRVQAQRVRRERDRERIAGVSQERTLGAALTRASEVLLEAFGATGVVLSVGGSSVFGAARAAFPSSLPAWTSGSPIPPRLLGEAPQRVIVAASPSEYGLNANRAVIGGLSWGHRAPVLIALLEPIEDASDALEELLPTLRDALERVELGERLESGRNELERRAGVIRDLVYAFSHDLRTPITANALNMKLALEGAFGALPPSYRDTLKNGIEANNDLLELADSLLVLARLESGEAPAQREVFSLEAAARSSAARLLSLTKLEWHVSGDSNVLGNAADLRRVLQNLLDNAAKFAPANSSIQVSLERKDATVRLEVADSGAGVATSLEPRLFQRFSSGKAGGGTGLGLYLARRILETHGGTIGYHPRVGGGSVFWLELPAALKTREPEPALSIGERT